MRVRWACWGSVLCIIVCTTARTGGREGEIPDPRLASALGSLTHLPVARFSVSVSGFGDPSSLSAAFRVSACLMNEPLHSTRTSPHIHSSGPSPFYPADLVTDPGQLAATRHGASRAFSRCSCRSRCTQCVSCGSGQGCTGLLRRRRASRACATSCACLETCLGGLRRAEAVGLRACHSPGCSVGTST